MLRTRRAILEQYVIYLNPPLFNHPTEQALIRSQSVLYKVRKSIFLMRHEEIANGLVL